MKNFQIELFKDAPLTPMECIGRKIHNQNCEVFCLEHNELFSEYGGTGKFYLLNFDRMIKGVEH